MKPLFLIAVLAILGLSLAGCAGAPPSRPDPRPFAGAVFVTGHYDRGGHWVRGHWI